jgi:hypothetical protein
LCLCVKKVLVRLFPLIAFLLAQVVSLPAPAGPPPDQQQFVLGVLRRDGIVSPFGAFDGKRWTTPWPADLRYVDVPISLDAVPARWWGKAGAPVEMSLWMDGSKLGTTRLDRLTTLRIMCASRLALTSGYRASEMAPPPMVQPYPKDGLAISTSQPIEAIETVPRTAPEWIAAAVGLIEPFNGAESAVINAISNWNHPIARKERLKVPVELEAMYSAPMDTPGWKAYYVEAVKRYPPGPDDEGCGLMTSARGWVTVGDGGPRTTLRAQLMYCDRRDDTYMLPLGLIKIRGRNFWIYQLSGYGREGYVVDRPMPRLVETHIRYEAGVCDR